MSRRGKIKYKDVVGKERGQQKKQSKKTRPRKTFSLYQNKKNTAPKRKLSGAGRTEDLDHKKHRKEEVNEVEDYLASSSEGEADDLNNLLNSFSNNAKSKKSLAIDSSSESESEIEEPDKEVLDGSVTEENSDDSSEQNESEIPDLSKIQAEHTSDVDDNEDVGLDHRNEVDDKDDPFVKHLFYELHDSLLDSVQNKPIIANCHTETWSKVGKLLIQIPKCEKIEDSPDNHFSISERKTFAPEGTTPKKCSSEIKGLFIKSQIMNNLSKFNNNTLGKEQFTPLQAEIFSVLNNYQDFYFPGRTFANSEEIRSVYCLHAVNHILKTRLKVIHHNARLSKKDDVPEEFRDQGLVRPKVLIIVPFKDSAYKLVRTIIDLILPEDKGNVINKNRFIEDYTGNELFLPKKNPKPEDYEQTFQGNTGDEFKIGITVTKKSLKLYADFYSSDIIIASPLGLRTIIGAEGEPERDYDFLASIELLILDQTEIFLMQNWDHALHIFNHLHLQPKESHGTDFSRVRTWSLNGWAKYYRQTVIVSSLVLPEINAVFNKMCQNYAGKVKSTNPIEAGCIGQVFIQVPHLFHRFDCESAAEAIDARFDFFLSKILPQQRESLMKQTLVFVPSYFDYVRLRNYFRREDIGFVQICEYSQEGKVARARDMFYHGDAHFLLYTERYHFFNRKRIKGIRHILFYQLPVFPHFYYEMCNLMQEANMNKKCGSTSNMSVTVIYSKYDVHQLAAVVGTEKAAKMSQSERKVHMMVTGAD